MADFQAVFTTAGRTLFAANLLAGDPTLIDSVEVGQANRLPAVGDTAVTTPFVPARIFTDPAGVASGPDVTWQFQDDSSDVYTVQEIAYYSGTTLVFSAAVDTGSILSKPGNTSAIFPIVIHFAGEDLSTITFTLSAAPVASESVAGIVQLAGAAEAQETTTGDQSLTKVLTVRRGWQQVAAWWNSGVSIAASRITGTLNIARIPSLPASRTTSGTFPIARGGNECKQRFKCSL